jgi:BMFP domain-containing protein YqiC
MPQSAETRSTEAILQGRIALLEHEVQELRAAKRLWQQMSTIDAARIRQLERQVQDSAGVASRARASATAHQRQRAGE